MTSGLFVNQGTPLRFYTPPGPHTKATNDLIRKNGGQVEAKWRSDIITLVDLTTTKLGAFKGRPVYSHQFILDSVSSKKLQNIDDYAYSGTDSPAASSTKKARAPFTVQEDKLITKYVDKHQGANSITGNKLWKIMEEKEIVPGRTWQSVKDRYLKRLLPAREAAQKRAPLQITQTTQNETNRSNGNEEEEGVEEVEPEQDFVNSEAEQEDVEQLLAVRDTSVLEEEESAPQQNNTAIISVNDIPLTQPHKIVTAHSLPKSIGIPASPYTTTTSTYTTTTTTLTHVPHMPPQSPPVEAHTHDTVNTAVSSTPTSKKRPQNESRRWSLTKKKKRSRRSRRVLFPSDEETTAHRRDSEDEDETMENLETNGEHRSEGDDEGEGEGEGETREKQEEISKVGQCISTLKETSGKSEHLALHALYVHSGDMELAQDYLQGYNDTNPWTLEEDDYLKRTYFDEQSNDTTSTYTARIPRTSSETLRRLRFLRSGRRGK